MFIYLTSLIGYNSAIDGKCFELIMNLRKMLEEEVDVLLVALAVIREWRAFFLSLVLLVAVGSVYVLQQSHPYQARFLLQPAVPPTFESTFRYYTESGTVPNVTAEYRSTLQKILQQNEPSMQLDSLQLIRKDGSHRFEVVLSMLDENVESSELIDLTQSAEIVMKEKFVDLLENAFEHKLTKFKSEFDKAEREFGLLQRYAQKNIRLALNSSDLPAKDQLKSELWLVLSGVVDVTQFSAPTLQVMSESLELLTINDFLEMRIEWLGEEGDDFASALRQYEQVERLSRDIDAGGALGWMRFSFVKSVVEELEVSQDTSINKSALFMVSVLALLLSLSIAALKAMVLARSRK